MIPSTTIDFYWKYDLQQVSLKFIFGKECAQLQCKGEIVNAYKLGTPMFQPDGGSSNFTNDGPHKWIFHG